MGREPIIGDSVRGGGSNHPLLTVERLPAFVHFDVLNDEPSPLSAKVETVLTPCDQREWLLDSGASKHMTPSMDFMTDLEPRSELVYIGEIIPPFPPTVRVLWRSSRMVREDTFPLECFMCQILAIT